MKTKEKRSSAERRRPGLIVGCGILMAVALGLMIAAELSLPTPPASPSQTASVTPGNGFDSAKVMIDSADGNGCWQRAFDNQTWRMTRSQQPCDTTARDSNGIPVPSGTIHRLDAISKSFAGK
jgi:hypothetical protein